jgi:hypothetical protein
VVIIEHFNKTYIARVYVSLPGNFRPLWSLQVLTQTLKHNSVLAW